MYIIKEVCMFVPFFIFKLYYFSNTYEYRKMYIKIKGLLYV